jgi:hypothetical protein
MTIGCMNIKESILRRSNSIQAKKSRRDRKGKGVYYTPLQVVDRITEKLLSEIDLSADPYIKILDPACGTGLFLIKAFQVLKKKFEENYEAILDRNKELEAVLKKDGIGSFILGNNLWGADIDREALDAAAEMLMKLAGRECRVNLVCCDSLISGSKTQISFYEEMMRRFGEPSLENYNIVYDGQLDTNDLEAIYTRCNANHPPGYNGHSLSMSDVVELYDAQGSSSHSLLVISINLSGLS